MKKLFIVLWLQCSGLYAAAQGNMYGDDESRVFQGGLVGGLNFSQIDGDSFYGYHKLGFNVGGKVYAHFSKTFGMSMELIYSQKGSRAVVVTESPYVGAYIYKYYMDVNYVEVPLVLHYVTFKYDIEVGASYARLIKSDEYVVADQPVYIDPEANRFNSSDIDFICGLSRQVYKKLFANIRYQYSLTSIRPPERIPVGYSYGNSGQFNNLFNLRLVYMF